MKIKRHRQSLKSLRPRAAGFSLMELLVAITIFLIISGAAVKLVKQHVPLVTSQQNQAGLNIAMRNAAAQLQVDVVNAGTGYYQGVNIPTWPIGVTVINNVAAADCYTAATNTYGPTCFDALNIIATDPNTPPSNPLDIGSNCVSTTSSTLFVQPTGTETLADLATHFLNGDQLLLVKSDGSQMTTTTLTKDAQVSGDKVQLQHNPTGADGTNNVLFDPLGISNTADSNKLGTQFCNTDWVLKLAPIQYYVDATDPTNPKLMRKQENTNVVVADQIIGFKVGALVWNGTSDTNYSFDASTYNHDWSVIRSIRISLIGRTPPDPANTFRNTFDQGPYKVEATSVVINPRNLSMNDGG